MRWMVLVCGLVGALVAPGGAVAAQEATEGDVSSVVAAVTYVIDPAGGAVDATVRVTVTNLDGAGGRAVDAVAMLLPVPAEDSIRATRNGAAMEIVAAPPSGDFQLFSLALGRPLVPGSVTELVVEFTLAPSGGNRESSTTRINEAYVSFVARGIGDPARGSLRVVVPADFESRWVDMGEVAVEPVVADEGPVRVFEAVGVGSEFVALVEARRDPHLDRHRLDVPGLDVDVEVAAWPDDPAWGEGVLRAVGRLVPELSDLIGEPWPLEGVLVIRETNAGVVHGFGGAFVRTGSFGGEIEVGPDYRDPVLAHELAHAWFDDRLDPWLAEGLAEEFARRATGGDGPAPDPPGVRGLGGWVPREGTAEEDRLAYAAAAGLLRRIGETIGPEALTRAVGDVLNHRSSYDASLPASTDLADWQRFLDAVGEAGGDAVGDAGGDAIEDELRAWVLVDVPEELLAERAEARAARADFEDRSGAWGVPLAISAALTAWDFDRAHEAIDAASALLDERDGLVARGDALGVASPPEAGERFAADPVAAAAVLSDQARGLRAVEQTREGIAADRTLLEAIGLWGASVEDRGRRAAVAYESGDHEAAVVEARQLRAVLAGADGQGRRRVAAVVAVLAAVGCMWVLLRLRRGRRPASVR